jgi:hypothetical protein
MPDLLILSTIKPFKKLSHFTYKSEFIIESMGDDSTAPTAATGSTAAMSSTSFTPLLSYRHTIQPSIIAQCITLESVDISNPNTSSVNG